MSVYTKVSQSISDWFLERANAIRHGSGLKPWTDTEDGFKGVSVNTGSKTVLDTQEEFDDLTKQGNHRTAADMAVPGARASFLAMTRRNACQACSGRLSKYDRAAISTKITSANIDRTTSIHDIVRRP